MKSSWFSYHQIQMAWRDINSSLLGILFRRQRRLGKTKHKTCDYCLSIITFHLRSMKNRKTKKKWICCKTTLFMTVARSKRKKWRRKLFNEATHKIVNCVQKNSSVFFASCFYIYTVYRVFFRKYIKQYMVLEHVGC